MTVRRAFALLVSLTILGLPLAVRAQEAQIVAAARVAAIADRIAQGLVVGPDRSIAPAYQVLDQAVPIGGLALAAAGSPFVTSTYVSVPVGIRVDGKLVRTVVAGYRVTTYVHTAVAARDLAPNTVIAPADLTLARVASNARPVVGIDSLIGRKLRSATAKGSLLYVEQTVPDDVVKPGQPALLVIHDGDVALAADVVARTGGAMGDVVTVFNPQTQRALAGVVTGPNRVEITLPGGAQR